MHLIKQRILTVAIMLAAASVAQAHFVFVVPEPDGAAAKVFVSETLKPDAAVGVEIIHGAKLVARSTGGSEKPLPLVPAGGAYLVELPGKETRLIYGLADLGLQQIGASKAPYVLLYHPKTILGDVFGGNLIGPQTPVEIVPVGKPGAMKLRLLVQGKPQSNSEITAILPNATEKKLKTDAAGETEVLTQSGRYGAWARYWEPTSGEREGKKYAEIRHYATLVFDANEAVSTASFARLPQAASSFGAVVGDGWLYVYGGHIAPTHSYSMDSVSGQFSRLKLAGGTKWEQLASGPALQGMNLAANEGTIYRVGGMAPRNKPGEKDANYSVAECARFDPAVGKWEPLPALPEPRSSHDVVVIGGKLIVAGGWTLKGAERTEWRDKIAVLDLAAPQLGWQSGKQPFKRRALIAAAFDGKMYLMGGFDDHGKITHEVSIYDPGSGDWTEGPQLPGGEMNGFSPAACVVGDSLVASLADGTLYRLSRSKTQWEKVGTATPRIAHRIAPDGNRILVIGGAANNGNSDLIESILIEPPDAGLAEKAKSSNERTGRPSGLPN